MAATSLKTSGYGIKRGKSHVQRHKRKETGDSMLTRMH